MRIGDNYVDASRSAYDFYLKFGNASTFRCSVNLWYITSTMNQRDFKKLIKVIIWACEDPEVILEAFRIIESAFTITIKLSKSAPKNMKYLQEVIKNYELQ